MVDDIANIQDKALLASFGINDEGSSEDYDTKLEEEVSHRPSKVTPELIDYSKQILSLSNYNWFELQERLKCDLECDVGPVLDSVFFHTKPVGSRHSVKECIHSSTE